jgi:ABC-type nitrate/sulfonate/bicarbonate transport system ATPase subunit
MLPINKKMTKKDIKVRGLSKSFCSSENEIKVLESVDFFVERGEIFCIVGPSGCGKSTLIKILLGLIGDYSGEIEIHEDRRKFAYVQQQPLMLPWRTLLQNATLGAEVRTGLNEDIIGRVNDRIKEYQLGGFENYLPGQLSGGMKQRADIIRALESLESTQGILFCDEPFSAVDFVTRLRLSGEFKNRCRVYGVTTVFVTHNIEEAIFLGDRVAVMTKRPGRIINTYAPRIATYDAAACRNTPEFSKLFADIWNDLKQ